MTYYDECDRPFPEALQKLLDKLKRLDEIESSRYVGLELKERGELRFAPSTHNRVSDRIFPPTEGEVVEDKEFKFVKPEHFVTPDFSLSEQAKEKLQRERPMFESVKIEHNPLIDDYVMSVTVAENSLLEQKIEEALQGSKHGVRILRRREFDLAQNRIILRTSVEVHESVPYGLVYDIQEDL